MEGENAYAVRTSQNWRQMKYFIAAMAGLAGMSILFHLSRRLGHWLRGSGRACPQPKALVALSRTSRNILLRKVPFLPSGGHALIVFCYVVINVILLVTNVTVNSLTGVSNYGSRAAYLAIGNVVVVVLLALKNTPLRMLTGLGYERLNCLHRAAGCMTVVLVVIHGSCYTASYAKRGELTRLGARKEVYGEIGGLALLLMGFAGVVVRRWWYELFYVVHVSLWMVAAVTISLHQPAIGNKVVIGMMVAGGMWVVDRLVRAVRLLVHGSSNSVTLTPLANGATRVTVQRAPRGARAGEHCFVWIGRVRMLETHPFSMAALDPLELVVSSHDGFTRDLHRYAVAHPGARLRASVEGPYGSAPNTAGYDTVLLVAGGSGATFTFGTALDMLGRLGEEEEEEKKKKHIVFVWIMRSEVQLGGFASHLDTLERDDRVSLQLYVTRPSSRSGEGEKEGEGDERCASAVDSEKSLAETGRGNMVSLAQAYDEYILRERPDVAGLVRTAIEGTRSDKRILVMGSGPAGLMNELRNAAARSIRSDGAGVEVHCEQFGY